MSRGADRESSFCIRSERVVLGDRMAPAAIHVREGRVAAIGEYIERPAGVRMVDVGSQVVMPGLVDTHVHINEPGRTDWEGFEHATKAAAAGGVTTVVDMPLNSIPSTTCVEGLDAKRRAATGQCYVDVGFWGGVVPGNQTELEPLARAGVLGFKCFLSPSGVDEFMHVDESDLRDAMPILAELGLPLLVHAEWPPLLRDAVVRAPSDRRRYSTWLATRPPEAEHAAIRLLITLAQESGARIHIVHLASADALPLIRETRPTRAAITVETCPHYLTFAAEDIEDGCTALKCAPPIRDRRHRDALWRAVTDGEIDLIATDHSPAPPSMKRLDGDFLCAWGGIASLQLSLPIVWTGARARGVPLQRICACLTEAPARLAGLWPTKGAIVPGADADLVVWDPDGEITVDAATLHHRHPITPYHGARLQGRVHLTMLRGAVICDEGQCSGSATGRLLNRASTR